MSYGVCSAGAVGEEGTDEEKKRQKRGGKGMVKAKKKAEEGPRKVVVFVAPRGKKRNTVITGLKTFSKSQAGRNMCCWLQVSLMTFIV